MNQQDTYHMQRQEQPQFAMAAAAFDPNSAASLLANWATQQGITQVNTTGSRHKRSIDLIGHSIEQQHPQHQQLQQQHPHYQQQLVPKPATVPQPSLPKKRRSSGINIARGQALLAAQAAEAAAATAAAEALHGPCEKSGRRMSKFKGVCWNKGNHRWQAAINAHGRYIYLGSFTDETEAAKAYDRAALHIKGPNTEVNFETQSYYNRSGVLLIDLQTSALLDKQTAKCTAGKVAGGTSRRPDTASGTVAVQPAAAAAVSGNTVTVNIAGGSKQRQQQQQEAHQSNHVQQQQQQQCRRSSSNSIPSAPVHDVAAATATAAAAVQHMNEGSAEPADADVAVMGSPAHGAAAATTSSTPLVSLATSADLPMLGSTAPGFNGGPTALHATRLGNNVPGHAALSPVIADVATTGCALSPAADLCAILAAGSRVGSSQPGPLDPADYSALRAIADLGSDRAAGQLLVACMPGEMVPAEVCSVVPVQPFCGSDAAASAAGQRHNASQLILGDAWWQQQQDVLIAEMLQQHPQPQHITNCMQQQGRLPIQQQASALLLQLQQQQPSHLIHLQQQQQQELLLLQHQQSCIEQQLLEQRQLQLQEDPDFLQLADQVAAEILSQQQPSQALQQIHHETSATIAKLLEQHTLLSLDFAPCHSLGLQHQQHRQVQRSDMQSSKPGGDACMLPRDQQLQWQQAQAQAQSEQQQAYTSTARDTGMHMLSRHAQAQSEQEQQPAAPSGHPAYHPQRTSVLDATINQELVQQQQVASQLNLQQQQQPAVSPVTGELTLPQEHIPTVTAHQVSPLVAAPAQYPVHHSAESKRNSPVAFKRPASTSVRAVNRSSIRSISMHWLLGQLPGGYQLEHIIIGEAGTFGVLCVQQQQVAQMVVASNTAQLQVTTQAGLIQHSSTPWMAAVWDGAVCHVVGSYATEGEARSVCVYVLSVGSSSGDFSGSGSGSTDDSV